MTAYSEMSEKERKAYNEARNAMIVSFNVGDPEIKAKLSAVAEADGRSVNNWIRKHVMPTLIKNLNEQYAELKKRKG